VHPGVAAGGVLIGTGRLRLDLELAGAKHLTGLGDIVEHQHAADFATAGPRDL